VGVFWAPVSFIVTMNVVYILTTRAAVGDPLSVVLLYLLFLVLNETDINGMSSYN